MESTLAQTAATALINISLAWIAGVLTARLWLMEQTAAWQAPVVARLSRAMPAGLTACAGGLLLSLWTEAAAMAELAWLEAWPAFSRMLASTHYGRAGVAAVALALAAIFVHRRLAGAGAVKPYLAAITLLLLLLAAARVTIGHAYMHGPLSVAVWVEWLHLVLVSIWAGIVFIAGWLVLPRVLATLSVPAGAQAAYLTSMSNWATAALAGILATGAYNAWRVLGAPPDLVQTDYGLVLMAKLCLVAVAMALGGYNRFFGLPAALAQDASAPQARHALRTVVAVLRIESLLLLLVLVAAAVLTGSAPPGQHANAPVPSPSLPLSESRTT